VITIGYRNIRTSDISGKVLDDNQVVTVVMRGLGKLFDASSDELTGLKPLKDVVEVELRHPDGKSEEIIVSKTDFDKVVTPEVLAQADNIRGRRNGFKPNGD
jgi:hypothetical protein